jgi:hypothetical protein
LLSHEAYGYQPPRVALCTCGWAFRAKSLASINATVTAHLADGCEGCDHAIRIEEVGR